jgi:hypothetical protein
MFFLGGLASDPAENSVRAELSAYTTEANFAGWAKLENVGEFVAR